MHSSNTSLAAALLHTKSLASTSVLPVSYGGHGSTQGLSNDLHAASGASAIRSPQTDKWRLPRTCGATSLEHPAVYYTGRITTTPGRNTTGITLILECVAA
ncbi:hypothetical protein CGMCC3_g8505 [Colletotrichum fructicola]|nr:uncharacterized protein CGMCC3_g8505 [Colletotrichum fructicola]KAE9575653.1 hypothetical protein CGMCC3_g8505 [Colletotrichum fructicola]